MSLLIDFFILFCAFTAGYGFANSRALAIEAGTDETRNAAQPVGQERGPIGNAHNAPPSPFIGSIDMEDRK